jgi:hypothetical protein
MVIYMFWQSRYKDNNIFCKLSERKQVDRKMLFFLKKDLAAKKEPLSLMFFMIT